MNLQIYEEASEWLVKHRNGGLDAGDKKLFDAWLRESPQHVRAYLEMSSVWEDVPALDPGWNPSPDELVTRARADVNVMPLDAPSARAHKGPLQASPQSVPEADSGGVRGWLLSALAASVLMAVAGTWFFLQRGVYSTATGEQRSLALTDGSTVELNSRSRIKVRYSDAERRIDLLEGQALFHVAKNKDRPFVVQADNTRVRAVGTAFDIYKATSGTVVTVVEGRVSVHRERVVGAAQDSAATVKHPSGASRGSASAEILLDAGEQLVVTPKAAPLPKQANVASATAWTRRSLVFDSSPLVEVAQEFNRYNTRQLVIEDAQLSDFHVSGVFSSVEPTLFLQFLRAQPELRVQETETEIRISQK